MSASREGISAWAIRHPTPVILLFVALTLAGVIALVGLPTKQLPDISFAMIRVTVVQPGASATELETQVARPVENAVFAIANVDHVRSTVAHGVSVTVVQFELGVDVAESLDKVRTAVDSIRMELPAEIEAPMIERLEIDDEPIATYTVASPDLSLAELSYFVDDTLARRFMAVGGVSKVLRLGGADREINVVLDAARLEALGVTAPEINGALRRFHLDASGGRTRIGDVEQTVRVLGAAETVEALRDFPIPTRQGGYTRLGDLARVGDGVGEERQFARLDGRPVVGFQVMKTKEGSEVDVEDGVNVELALVREAYPDIKIERVASVVDATRKGLTATTMVLLEGMVLAALVVFLFLREWRSTLIAAVAMPLSLVPTFAAMRLFGFSLNQLTLLALTLVIGILVDDAIVEIENIQKRVERGLTPFRAALVGGDAIGLAVVATTFSIVVVFAPVSFMPGVGGQFFQEFGMTVAVSVLFSLVVARLLTPLLAAYFLEPGKGHTAVAQQPRRDRVLEWTLKHRWTSLAAGIATFVASLGIAATLPSGFMPHDDNGYFQLIVRGSPGAVRETMERTVAELTRRLHEHPDVEHVFAAVGGEANGDDLRAGTALVVLREDRAKKTNEVKAELRPTLRGVPDALVATQGGLAGSAADVEIVLVSEDPKALEAAALRLQREIRSVEGISDIRTGTPPPGPELVVRPRAQEAARLGVASESIADIVRVSTIGETDARTPKLTIGERRIPVRVRLAANEAGDLTLLRNLPVPTADGGTTRLANVADLSFQAGPPKIERYDRARQIAVQGDLVPGYTLGQATAGANALPALRELPAGVHNAAYGDAEAMAELFSGFAGAMVAGVLLIFAVLVLLFGGFTKPFVILSALPLSLAGAFVALAVLRMAIELPVLIGLLMLLGIAAKNSILLVEFAIEQERLGATRKEALAEARRERTRPILMTTYAMAAGMLPAAIGLGEGYEVRQAMAVAVIGGMASSTALSLVLVPVVYSLVADAEEWLAPRIGRLVTPVSAEDRAPSAAREEGGLPYA